MAVTPEAAPVEAAAEASRFSVDAYGHWQFRVGELDLKAGDLEVTIDFGNWDASTIAGLSFITMGLAFLVAESNRRGRGEGVAVVSALTGVASSVAYFVGL